MFEPQSFQAPWTTHLAVRQELHPATARTDPPGTPGFLARLAVALKAKPACPCCPACC